MALETTAIHPRFLIVADHENPVVRRLVRRLRAREFNNHTAIVAIGGDGTMLYAIRRHWRKRLPFLGINTGHRGFLMNDASVLLEERPFVVRSSRLLRVAVKKPNGKTRVTYAFNDAHVRVKSPRAGWFEVSIDCE